MSVLLNVFEVPAQNFKVWKVPIVADSKVIFRKIRELSQKRVADCTFSDWLLYFKGEPKRVEEELQKDRIIVGEPEEITLSPQGEGGLIRDLLYSSLEGVFYKRGWRAPIGKRKRALPQTDGSYGDLYLRLREDVAVLFGLRYMFEVGSGKNLRLWLDVYAPLWSVPEKRLLHVKEIDAKLRELYVRKALLHPKRRYEKNARTRQNYFRGQGHRTGILRWRSPFFFKGNV